MKFSIHQKDLQRLLNIAGDAVPKKTTLPILSNFLIDARANTVHISATDLEISISTSAEATVDTPGQVAVNAKRLQEVVRELAKEQVEIHVEAGKFILKCARSQFDLFPMPVDDFPTLAQERASFSTTLSPKTFRGLVDLSCYAVSTDETRPALRGVLVQVVASEIRFVATDSHRLSKAFAHGKFAVDKSDIREAIIPPKALVPVAAWAMESDADVEMELSGSAATFKVGATTLTSRLLQGPFPKYEQVIPKDNHKALVIGREALLASIRRVAKLSDSVSHQIRLSVRKNRLHLSVNTADIGAAKDDLEATYAEDDLEIGYNAVYLQDILKSLETDKVQFNLNSSTTAGVVTPMESKADAQAMCLIMPLRLQD